MNFLQRALIFTFAFAMTLNILAAVLASHGLMRGLIQGVVVFALTVVIMVFLAWVVAGKTAVVEAVEALLQYEETAQEVRNG